jgi:PAS domain S-box-containing protein
MTLAHESRTSPPQAPTRNISRRILQVCSFLALFVSVLALAGWFGDVEALKTVLPGLPALKPMGAIGLGAGAIAVVLALQARTRQVKVVALGFSLVAVLIGLAALLQYQTGIDLGLFTILIDDDADIVSPVPLSFVTAIDLALLGVASGCVTFPRAWTRLIAWACSLLGLLIAFFGTFLTLLEIFYDPGSVYDTAPLTSIALHAGSGFFILFSGLLLWGCRDSLRLPLVALALLVLAPLAAIMVFFAITERRAALDAGRDRVVNHAQMLSGDTGQIIDNAHALLQLASETSVISNRSTSDKIETVPDCDKFLDELARLYSWVTLLRVSDLDGNAICSSNSRLGGTSIVDRSYFAEAVQSDRFTLSGLLFSRATRQPRLFAALPLHANGTTIGVVSLAIDLTVFGEITGHVGLEPGETVTVVSRSGLVFANRPQPPDLVGTRLDTSPAVQRALIERTGTARMFDWTGHERMFAFSPIAETHAAILVGLDTQTLTRAIDDTLKKRMLLIALIMAGTTIASLLGGELLVFWPLRKLAWRATRIERGDFDDVALVGGLGEIWTLHNAFVRMRDAIADRERRLSDALERHRAVFDSAIDAIITINESGSIESLNPAAEELFGYSAEDLLHRNITVLLPGSAEQDQAHAIGNLQKALLGLGQVSELAARRADGTVFPADVALSEMRLGERLLLVAVVRDASERKRVEQLKSEFVSTVSHELRTPLTSISGSLGLLSGGAAGALSETAQRLISIAHRNSQRLIRLINDILDLEKIEAGKLAFTRAPVSVHDLAVEAMDANQAYAQTHGIELILKATPGDTTVVGDRDRLMQVVTNLLSNAIKFSPRGEKVEMCVGRNGDTVRLTVADHGPGIPDEFRPRMFTRFAQADSSDARGKGGTGLGLAVAKEIVEHHSGHLTFVTEIGRGTAFHVDLPSATPGAKPGQTDAPADILMIEDDHDTAIVLRDTLAQSGFSTAIATTAKEAQSLLAASPVKVIMVDLGLPDQDGISLIRTLRAQERTRRIPIIVVTARKPDEAGVAEVDALEVLDWIEKPVDITRLHNALDLAIAPSDGVRILHVEDDPDVRHLVAQALAGTGTIHSASTLAQATAELAKFEFDAVILDMNLPDGSASALLPQLKNHAGQTIPVIVFSARETDVDVSKQVQAVLTKSQNSLDYLVRIVTRLCQSKADIGNRTHQLEGSA